MCVAMSVTKKFFFKCVETPGVAGVPKSRVNDISKSTS